LQFVGSGNMVQGSSGFAKYCKLSQWTVSWQKQF